MSELECHGPCTNGCRNTFIDVVTAREQRAAMLEALERRWTVVKETRRLSLRWKARSSLNSKASIKSVTAAAVVVYPGDTAGNANMQDRADAEESERQLGNEIESELDRLRRQREARNVTKQGLERAPGEGEEARSQHVSIASRMESGMRI